MSVNSHIQITKFILKQFRSDDGKVWHFDLEENRIRSCSSADLGTAYGYYSEKMETYLNKEIEKPFADYVAKIISFTKDSSKSLNLPIKVEDICKRFVTAAAYRSKFTMDYTFCNSYNAFLLSDQTNHDQTVFFGTQLDNGILPILQTYKMLVIINESGREFVVPRNCFYIVSSQGIQCIIMPVSPNCALELVPENYTDNIHDGIEERVEYIDNPDDVLVMNNCALQFEYAFNHSFVASASREELSRLKEYCDANHEFLELNKLKE
ncbi:MAG: DUF4238 domain-containing protein [Clostridiales bacterium]|nr:DUF4238 domain-containing protein [Clostridiales bacterium]